MSEQEYYEDPEERLCSSIDWCDHHHVLDDCGAEYCDKYDLTWNTWNGENGCDMMADLGYSPYDEEDDCSD